MLGRETIAGKIVRLIYNQPALLIPKNGLQFARDVKRLGFSRVYDEEISKCWQKAEKTRRQNLPVEVVMVGPVPLWNGDAAVKDESTVSVIIPVKDAGNDLARLLAMLTSQKGFKEIEIVVVDSGSSDDSPQLAKKFNAKVVVIRPEDFSHSYARNLGAEHATGEYLLFTVQDALPPSNTWLYELFRVLKDTNVAAVSCAEFPREDSDLFYRANCWGHYRFLGVDEQDRILSKPENEDYLSLRKNGQLSDLACLISRELFSAYRFRGSYAEDLELGLRLIRDGHKLAFLSSAKIIHSHNRSAYYHLKRGYVDAVLLCQIFPDCGILASEPERLLRDIIFMHAAITTMIDRLSLISPPCAVTVASDLIKNFFRDCTIDKSVTILGARPDEYLDGDFHEFLTHLCEQGDDDETSVPFDSVLNDAMQGAAGTLLQYLEHTYEIIDQSVLEDLTSSIFKLFAFQCGTHLGACYVWGTPNAKRYLAKINEQLSNGI